MRVTGEIERKLDDLFTAHLARVGAQFESVGGTNGTGQGLNVANGQPLEPVGDGIQDSEQDASHLLTRSSRLDEQVSTFNFCKCMYMMSGCFRLEIPQNIGHTLQW